MAGWEDAHDERLEALRNQGLSATEIGRRLTDEFGTLRNRNAVLGRARRLGLCNVRDELRAAQLAARKAKEAGFDKAQAEAALNLHMKPQTRMTSIPPAPPWVDPARLRAPTPIPVCDEPIGGVTFAELRGELDPFCRWIPGEPNGAETVYCGQPRLVGKSYCASHYARTLAPNQPRLVLPRRAA